MRGESTRGSEATTDDPSPPHTSVDETDNAHFLHNQSIDSNIIGDITKSPAGDNNINDPAANLTISVTNSSISSQDSGLPSNTGLDNSSASPKDLKYFSSEDSGFVSL